MKTIEKTEPTNFNDIRFLLLNPTNDAAQARKGISLGAASCKAIFGVGEITMGSIAAVSLVATINFPLFALIAIPSFLTALGSHEARVISQNIEELFEGNLINRSQAALSPDRFTRAILKGSLVAERLFSSCVAKSLALG